MGKKKAKKPSGLSLTRSRGKFTCSWKKGEKYSAQKFQRLIDRRGKADKWVSVDVSASATKQNIVIDPEQYFPVKSTIIDKVSFRVKGKTSKKSYSKTITKSLILKAPAKPVVAFTQDAAYTTTFGVEANRHVNDRGYWSTYVEYQTVLAINENYKKQEDVQNWGTITKKQIYDSLTQQDTTSFTETITETSEDISRIAIAVSKKQSAVRRGTS